MFCHLASAGIKGTFKIWWIIHCSCEKQWIITFQMWWFPALLWCTWQEPHILISLISRFQTSCQADGFTFDSQNTLVLRGTRVPWLQDKPRSSTHHHRARQLGGRLFLLISCVLFSSHLDSCIAAKHLGPGGHGSKSLLVCCDSASQTSTAMIFVGRREMRRAAHPDKPYLENLTLLGF